MKYISVISNEETAASGISGIEWLCEAQGLLPH